MKCPPRAYSTGVRFPEVRGSRGGSALAALPRRIQCRRPWIGCHLAPRTSASINRIARAQGVSRRQGAKPGQSWARDAPVVCRSSQLRPQTPGPAAPSAGARGNRGRGRPRARLADRWPAAPGPAAAGPAQEAQTKGRSDAGSARSLAADAPRCRRSACGGKEMILIWLPHRVQRSGSV